MKGSQVKSSSQKSSQVSVLHSAASVTTSKDFLKSNAIKVQMTKFFISVFFITALKALFQGSYCRKPHAKIPNSP